MNDDTTENEILEPGPNPLLYCEKEFQDSTHCYPSSGFRHQTKDCWCRPDVRELPHSSRLVYIHREFEGPKTIH